jgi:hypothetical protein
MHSGGARTAHALIPWLRVHERMGGEVADVAPAAMTVEGSLTEWEGWTGIAFPDSGSFVVPGGLVPVEIDVTEDAGRYVEPAVWVQHRCRRSVAPCCNS